MTDGKIEPYKIVLTIPFETQRSAEIAYDVLRIDQEPKRSFITKKLQIVGNNLQVEFTGDLMKNLRVGVTSFFEVLILCCQTLKEFGPPAEKYNHY